MTSAVELALPLIKAAEGLRLRPYLCPANVPTIGWGSTTYEDGKRVTLQDRAITSGRAEDLLEREASRALQSVVRLARVPLSPPQAAALLSFVYNLGAGRLKASTLLRRVNAGEDPSDEFGRWVMGGQPIRRLPGLIKRREAERLLWQSGSR